MGKEEKRVIGNSGGMKQDIKRLCAVHVQRM